ncbi:ABC transporter substrate-binding protein [Thalassobaculum sp.]|uniref:ABC transporter substrate-binding protein n=1 Tax=Thalassobaculum sp. TaxID=2022740 RepID=UPI0032ED8E7B
MQQATTIVQGRVDLIDPHDCSDDPDALAILEAVHSALVRRGPDARWRPALAERWSVSDDARTWTFQVRPGVHFHDGAPVDAEAVAYSIARMARPDMGATLGAPAVYAQYLSGAGVEALDRSRVRITLERPLADLLDILGSGYVLSPASDDRQPVGCGAYRVDDYAPGNQLTVRTESGHFSGEPANPILRWWCVADRTERLEALLSGKAQVASDLGGAGRGRLAGETTITCVDHLSPTAIIYLLNAARGPLQDSRVRRALNLALDRAALVESVLGGAGEPLCGFVSPMHFGAIGDTSALGRDLDTARRLLGEAGWSDGLALDVDCPTRLPDEAEALTGAVASQLAEVGVSLNVHRVEDRTAYANQVRLKQIHDLCVFDSSPMSTFRVLYEKIDARVAGSWWQGYHSSEAETLLDRARTTVDDGEREALYRRCYGVLQNDPPWLYLYNHRRFVGLSGVHRDWRMRADGVLDVATLPRF